MPGLLRARPPEVGLFAPGHDKKKCSFVNHTWSKVTIVPPFGAYSYHWCQLRGVKPERAGWASTLKFGDGAFESPRDCSIFRVRPFPFPQSQSCMMVPPPPACARPSALLLLLPRSTIRGAMVNIMLAGGSPQHHLHHHSARPLLFQPSSTWCEHGFVDTTQDCFGDISAKKEASDWSDAPPVAEGGTPRLPRDSSTCILWCAIALGALVRGHPIPQVGLFLSSLVSRPAPPLPCKPDVTCNLSARAILTRLATLASRRKFRLGVIWEVVARKVVCQESAAANRSFSTFISFEIYIYVVSIDLLSPLQNSRCCDLFHSPVDHDPDLARWECTLTSPKIHCGLAGMMLQLIRPGGN